MLSKIHSAAIDGIEAVPITIEADISRGMPAFNIVGQPDSSVKEARERIRSALYNLDMEYPGGRITINLSPADIRKKGSHFDLAMAVGILCADRQLFDRDIADYCFIGELSLDGTLQKSVGVLPMTLAAKKAGIRNVVIPGENSSEAALIEGINIFAVSSLREVYDHFNLDIPMNRITGRGIPQEQSAGAAVDFADVKGQESAKRALTVAAAGGHGVLMIGSPSTGKTMLAERMPTIMPSMSTDEILETTIIYSIAGLLDEKTPCISQRPFRQPHHRTTPAGLLGGGTGTPRPGEITLAHNGVLFLDEAGEFSRPMIEALRTPLEKKNIAITRRGRTYVFPADFMLVAASNPCKCGYYQDPDHRCKCSEQEVRQYQRKLSGPILERIDLHLHLSPVDCSSLSERESISSAEMKNIIEEARRVQRERYRGTGIFLNQQLEGRMLEKYCTLGEAERNLIYQAYSVMKLNPRSLMRIKRVARTIADIDGSERIEMRHLSEALGYRGSVL